jgi:carbamoyl-phosphate synthase large subunit
VGGVFISVRDRDKPAVVEAGRRLAALGYTLIATRGTAESLRRAGLEVRVVNKVLEGRPHIEDAIRNREVQLVINTTEGQKALSDSKSLRRAALVMKIPYFTTISGALAASEAIAALKDGEMKVRPLQAYFA